MTLPFDLAGLPASPEPWPKVDLSLLDEREGAPPSFPLDVLPPFWRRWTEDAAAAAGAPVDYVALSLMTAAGSLMPDRRVMAAPGWSEPCSLWTALVGPPSCGKTWGLERACSLLGAVESRRRRGPHNPDGRVSPEPLFTNAANFGAIFEAMQQADPRGMLLVRDEHGGWLSHMARGTRDGSAHAFWMAAWCQRGIDFGWRGRTVELGRPSLAILGTAHPEALAPALTRDDGGVLARFLFVRPLPQARRWPLPQTDSVTPAAAAALQRLCRWSGGDQLVPLTPEALAAFERFGRANADPPLYLAGKEAAWWGKGPSQVLRLAGILTFLEWSAQPHDTAEPQQVPAWAVEAAARLWRNHLWPHAQATFRIAGAGAEREDRKRQVLRWLPKQGLQQVSREQIRREALSQALDAAATSRLIEELVEGGWLREQTPDEGRRGRRRRRWDVHPGLWFGAYQQRAQEALAARPHPELDEGSSVASPAARAESEVMATHATAPISAVPATDPNPVMATAQIDPNGGAVSWPGARPYLELDDGSSDASPVALVDGDIIEIAAPAILAISASASDSTAMAAAAPGSDLAEAHSSLEGTGASDTSSPAPSADRVPAEPRDAISAISASAFDAATGRAVTSPDAAVPIAAHPPADDGTSPPRLDAHERRRGRWRENRVPLHQPLDQAPAVA